MSIEAINKTQFNKDYSLFTGFKEHNAHRMGTVLFKNGLVKAGGRGEMNISDMSLEDILNIVIASLAAEKATQADVAVKRTRNLKSAEGRFFIDRLMEVNSIPDYPSAIHVYKNYPLAKIYWGYENDPESQREEVFGDESNVPSLAVISVLDGSVLKRMIKMYRFVNNSNK